MVLFAVGLPLFILYNIFSTGEAPVGRVEGFEKLKSLAEGISTTDYRIHSIQDDGGVFRVNILFTPAPGSQEEVRRRTLNALYDVQAVVGRDVTVSVWSGAETEGGVEFLGMAFFSSITETTHFKTAAEIR